MGLNGQGLASKDVTLRVKILDDPSNAGTLRKIGQQLGSLNGNVGAGGRGGNGGGGGAASSNAEHGEAMRRERELNRERERALREQQRLHDALQRQVQRRQASRARMSGVGGWGAIGGGLQFARGMGELGALTFGMGHMEELVTTLVAVEGAYHSIDGLIRMGRGLKNTGVGRAAAAGGMRMLGQGLRGAGAAVGAVGLGAPVLSTAALAIAAAASLGSAGYLGWNAIQDTKKYGLGGGSDNPYTNFLARGINGAHELMSTGGWLGRVAGVPGYSDPDPYGNQSGAAAEKRGAAIMAMQGHRAEMFKSNWEWQGRNMAPGMRGLAWQLESNASEFRNRPGAGNRADRELLNGMYGSAEFGPNGDRQRLEIKRLMQANLRDQREIEIAQARQVTGMRAKWEFASQSERDEASNALGRFEAGGRMTFPDAAAIAQFDPNTGRVAFERADRDAGPGTFDSFRSSLSNPPEGNDEAIARKFKSLEKTIIESLDSMQRNIEAQARGERVDIEAQRAAIGGW